jgi:two-component system NtrC family response regulator
LIRELIAEWLCAVGYGTVVACDAQCAMLCFEAAPVDLVVTDLRMPHWSGEELIAAVGRKHPEVRIIAMSALLERTSAGRPLMVVGADQTLSKPFTREELLGSVRSVIGPPG